ncbi:hypothetical protein [Pseudonocardia sp.]|uniref:hypothetical protein n=1 Tax=Pseudonocardia sp. TaxID=60912 RepID=UPI003D10AEE9
MIVRLADVLAWAAARLDTADWARLDELGTTRAAAIVVDHELRRRQTYRPNELTEADRVRIAASNQARWAAERAAHDLIAAALPADTPSAAEQLALFTWPRCPGCPVPEVSR